MTEITLGIQVRDIVTGFTGITIGKALYINGCIQYLVAPKVGEDNKKEAGCYYDHQRLEIVGENVAPNIVSVPMPEFTLGIKAKDISSGVVGILTSRQEFFGGLVEYHLQPSLDKDGKAVEGSWVLASWLEVVTPEPLKMPSSNTGGPSAEVRQSVGKIIA